MSIFVFNRKTIEMIFCIATKYYAVKCNISRDKYIPTDYCLLDLFEIRIAYDK